MSQSTHTVTVDLSDCYKKLGFDPSTSAIGTVFRLIMAEKIQSLVTLSLVGECLAQATKQMDRQQRKRKVAPAAPANAGQPAVTQKSQPAAPSDEKAQR